MNLDWLAATAVLFFLYVPEENPIIDTGISTGQTPFL